MPTQLIMITSGALTVYGGLSLPVTIAVGALGVFVGDLACYLLGRSAPDRRPARPPHPDGPRRAASRVTHGLREPGPLVILLCRFVPGGRMAACFSAGRSRYPYRLFLPYEAVAALAWATYGALVGHLGGTALTHSAWRLAAGRRGGRSGIRAGRVGDDLDQQRPADPRRDRRPTRRAADAPSCGRRPAQRADRPDRERRERSPGVPVGDDPGSEVGGGPGSVWGGSGDRLAVCLERGEAACWPSAGSSWRRCSR